MKNGLCPKCHSNNVTKECVSGEDTCHYTCLDCGFTGMPEAFKIPHKDKRDKREE